MKDSVFLVFIVLMKALVSFTEDDASSVIFCNMELLTWQEAVENCKNKGGYMPPFETGLEQNIDRLNIQSDADIWTADHLTLNRYDEYCGFNYLNSTINITREVLYGDCFDNRNYFCITEKGMLVVYNSTRDKVNCNYNVLLNDLQSMRSRIKPGYYWNNFTVHGTAITANTTMLDNLNIQDILCGGYKSSIGKYYANCTAKRFSLCTQNLDVWIHVVVPLRGVLLLTFGITVVIYIYRKRLQKRERIDQPTNISNLTTVAGQNDYETLQHQQGDEHEYSSARQVDKDRVAMNTYVNDVIYREDK